MSTPQEATGEKDALAPAKSQPNPPQRILVADDDTIIRQLYSRVLIRSGYQVDTAEDGEAAWEMLHAERHDPDSYNLLLTDNNMPKVSGVELVGKLRSAYIVLPVILASAATPRNTQGLRLSAILQKPFSLDKLVQTVKEVLQGQMPNRATAKLKNVARRLLVHEAASGKPPGAMDSAAFRVWDKLRGPLGKLMGLGCIHSLLSRALVLAGAEVRWLRALQIKPDGSLKGLDELEAKLDSRAIAQGQVILVSQLLGLLVAFIGSALTLGLLRDIWPKLDDLDS